jgi:hypothetical protein
MIITFFVPIVNPIILALPRRKHRPLFEVQRLRESCSKGNRPGHKILENSSQISSLRCFVMPFSRNHEILDPVGLSSRTKL